MNVHVRNAAQVAWIMTTRDKRLNTVSAGSFHLACSLIALVLLAAPSTLQAATATAVWNRSPEPDVAGYKLSYGTESQNYTTVLDVGNVTSWTVQLPTQGRYYFAVQAYNNLGMMSPYSPEIPYDVPTPNPAMSLDRPLANSSSGTNVTVSGWAADLGASTGTGANAVHVYAFPTGGGSPIGVPATYGLPRPDVGAAFGSRFTNSGFQAVMNSVPAGSYNFTAYMHSTVTGTFSLTATATNVTVNATTSNPQMNIDAPSTGASRARTFIISGWAVDTGAISGPGIDAIHVWAFPVAGGPAIFVGVGAYGSSRPDVGAYIGSSQFNNCGYSINITTSNLPMPGLYDFHVFAHSAVTGNFPIARIVRVNVS